MNAPIAFVDTETTGLGPTDHVWEFACHRVSDGQESTTVIHIEHDWSLMDGLPDKFKYDHDLRFGQTATVETRHSAALIIDQVLDGAHIIGANPAFDAGMLQRLLAPSFLKPSWHYHLIDLEAMTLGYLAARGESAPIPWRSDDLSARVGVPTKDESGEPLYDRHTALGDITWCRDWWNALTGPATYADNSKLGFDASADLLIPGDPPVVTSQWHTVEES